jgi:hypothetical protein
MTEDAYYHVFCDESCISDRYHVIGGLIIHRSKEEKIKKHIDSFRIKTNMTKELKWTKIKNQKLDQYIEFANIGLDLFQYNAAHFHVMIMDSHKFNHKRFSAGSAETTFYKMMYQFVLHKFGKYLKPQDRFSLFLDQRSTSYSLQEFKLIMNRGLKKRYSLATAPLRDVVPVNSKNHDLIQMADVFMGAVGFRVNAKDAAENVCSAKKTLCGHIESCLGVPSLANPIELPAFSSWHFQLKK